MARLLVIYYSSSGNTEKMAEAVAEGAKGVGNVEVELNYRVGVDELSGFDSILVGTGTYNHEMPSDLREIFEEAASRGINLKGKIGSAFGSYGWSGEAPKYAIELLKNKLEMRVIEPPIMAIYAPDAKTLTECKELGRKISEMIVK